MTLLLLGCVRCDFEKRRASSRAQAGGRRRAGRPPRRPFPQQRPQHHPPPASLRSGAKRQRGRGRRPSGQSPAPRRTALPMPHANGGLSSKHLSFPTARCLALGQCRFSVKERRGGHSTALMLTLCSPIGTLFVLYFSFQRFSHQPCRSSTQVRASLVGRAVASMGRGSPQSPRHLPLGQRQAHRGAPS